MKKYVILFTMLTSLVAFSKRYDVPGQNTYPGIKLNCTDKVGEKFWSNILDTPEKCRLSKYRDNIGCYPLYKFDDTLTNADVAKKFENERAGFDGLKYCRDNRSRILAVVNNSISYCYGRDELAMIKVEYQLSWIRSKYKKQIRDEVYKASQAKSTGYANYAEVEKRLIAKQKYIKSKQAEEIEKKKNEYYVSYCCSGSDCKPF